MVWTQQSWHPEKAINLEDKEKEMDFLYLKSVVLPEIPVTR